LVGWLVGRAVGQSASYSISLFDWIKVKEFH
jgi:hypothetical protein